MEIDDIGEITGENIVEFFHDKNIVDSIDILLSKGIKINKLNEDKSSNKLEGINYVITGSIEGYNRDDIKKMLEDCGANVRSSVSKNTDVVLAGEKAGSKRIKLYN